MKQCELSYHFFKYADRTVYWISLAESDEETLIVKLHNKTVQEQDYDKKVVTLAENKI